MSFISRLLNIFKKKQNNESTESVRKVQEPQAVDNVEEAAIPRPPKVDEQPTMEDPHIPDPPMIDDVEAATAPSEVEDDKWTETRRLLSMLNPEEYQEVIEDNRESCVCKNCPSYVACESGGEGLFCCEGESPCISEAPECLCGGCPVRDLMGLKHSHYCIMGDESGQRGF